MLRITHSRLIRQLNQQQKVAESQDEWMDLAEQVDSIQGNDIWRTEKTCPLYESERIQSRIDELVRLMEYLRTLLHLIFNLQLNKIYTSHIILFSRST